MITNKDYLEYIKGFSKISISSICRELKIDRSNLLRGFSSKCNEKRVYDKIQEKLKELEKGL